ncbi:MAG: SusC/RagA family TonB-linked outer membrane protein [Bacteroidota bacterium]
MYLRGPKLLVASLCCLLWVVGLPALRAAPVLNPVPLAQSLDEIGRRYGVFFTYNAELVAGVETDFTPVADESLEVAIDRLLDATNLGYEAFGEKYFVLFEDTKRGRRKVGKLRRKVRQLDRLEHGKEPTRILRGDRTPQEQLGAAAGAVNVSAPVSGVVTDRDGIPLVGVNIRLVGTQRGEQTDANGNFSLPLDAFEGTLAFSYLGYRTVRKRALPGGELTITLAEAETKLPEVLIVGYGRVNAVEATASVAQVETDAIAHSQALTTPHEWLRGRVAGVQVLAGNGEPGTFQSIRVRGSSSMNASNEPLYVIDGMPVDNTPHLPGGVQPGRNPLNALNPADVARVTVLKDAAAGAIYGSRAANGVVLIETKGGRLFQEGKLSYDAWFSVATPARELDVYDAAGYRELVSRLAPHRLDELGDDDTDWQRSILRTAPSQQHTLSYAAGGENAGYRISLGYLERNSITDGASGRRLSAALNGRRDFFDHQLKLTGDVKLSRVRDRFVSANVVGNAYSFNPTLPIRDAASPWSGYFEYENDLAPKNPRAEVDQVRDESRDFRFLGHLRASFAPKSIPGLRATLFGGNDVTTGLRNYFAPSTSRIQFVNKGEFRYARQERSSRLFEAYLNYDRRLASDRFGLSLTGGYTYQHYTANYPEQAYFGITNTAYSFGQIPENSDEHAVRADFRENRLASFFGRGGFDWQHKYFLTASFRLDGSSRFSPSNRWAAFPAVSAAWRISEEGFLKGKVRWLDELKLRAGWGLTGNQEIGDYQYLPTYTFGEPEAAYQFGDEYVLTARANAVSTDLKWEQTASANLALEARLFGGRLRTTVEGYRSTTRDLLSSVIVPAGSNLSDVVLTNVGSIRNTGFEFSADVRIIERQRFGWSLGVNLATNQNRILSLGNSPGEDFQAISTGTISGGTGNTIQLYEVGQALSSFYVFRHLRTRPNGVPLPDGVDHNNDGRVDLADIYADENGDGIVNDRDKRVFQQPAPTLFGGLQTRIRYGAFGIQTSLRAQTGNYVYNNLAAFSESYDRILREPELLNVPRSITGVGFRSPQLFSDYYIEDASFLRMDALTLDYTHPKKNKRPEFRLYATLQNVFTITPYRGLDPEVGNVSGNPGDPRYGIDDLVFPRPRTFLVGLNSTF